MKFRTARVVVVFLSLILSLAPLTVAQTSTQTASALPRLVRFGGTVKDLNGTPLTGVVGITFALYSEQTGGAALWLETQNVTADSNGRYTALLGSTKPDGLPVELFTSEQARWVGVQVSGQAEQPRVLLISVPYALKAADARTIGGLPPSAFVLAAPPNVSSASTASPSAAQPLATGTTPVTTAGGTVNKLAKFDATADITSSQIFDNGTNVGIGNTAPDEKLDVSGAATVRGTLFMPAVGTATASAGYNSQALRLTASAFNSGTATAVAQKFQWQTEPAGNNTATTSGTLNLLYATGTATPAETGLKISSKGLFTFATGQTFPGTVKSVGLSVPSTDFTVSGSPVTSTGTLNLAWNIVPTSANTVNAIVKRDATGSFSAGAGTFAGNVASGGTVSGAGASFTGNMTVGGTISGNGSGLTSLHGVLVTELLGNVDIIAGTALGYYDFGIDDYVPPVNATAFTFSRCGISATAAGQVLYFRSAIRTPTGSGGTVMIGNAFYVGASSAATEIVFEENNDYFQLTAGQSYDFGVNFFNTPPAGPGYCSEVVQIFAN